MNKKYKAKPKVPQTMKRNPRKYLSILSIIFLFTTTCGEEEINGKIAKQRTYDLSDYEKVNSVTENVITFLKTGEYSKKDEHTYWNI